MTEQIRLAERRAALRRYVRREARDAPPVFVGRQPVVNDIETTAGTAWEVWREGEAFPGLTRVVQGAPGAGKSSLLAHLRRKWEAARKSGDKTSPLAVNISLLDLRDPPRFREAVENLVPASLGARYVPAVAGALVKLVAPGSRLNEEVEKEVRAFSEKRDLPHPVVLMVDEAQNARPHENESAILAHLHEGHLTDLPVLLVLAGLGFLREHLQQPGIRLTRFSDDQKSVHTLGAISDGEVRELFDGWLEHFSVAATHDESARWADAMVRDSQGWPMHTNHFLTALAGQLLAPGYDPGQLASADLDAVRHAAAERRLAYYGTRYDNPLLLKNKNARAVGRTMAALRLLGPAEQDSVFDAIRDAFGVRSEAEADAVFDVLRERGFLQRATDPNLPPSIADAGVPVYACPIPSLASYAAARGSVPHLAATLGDTNSLGRLVKRNPESIDARDAMGRSPLHVAAECRWKGSAELLLAANADPDAPDTTGATPRASWPEFEWPEERSEQDRDNTPEAN